MKGSMTSARRERKNWEKEKKDAHGRAREVLPPRGLTQSPTRRSTLTLTLLGARVLCGGSENHHACFGLATLKKPKLHLPRGINHASWCGILLFPFLQASTDPVQSSCLDLYHPLPPALSCSRRVVTTHKWFTKAATPVEHSSSFMAMLHTNH